MSGLHDGRGLRPGQPSPSAWYEDHGELIAFATALHGWGAFHGNSHQVIKFFEKPWKWEVAHHVWVAAGRPMPEEDGWHQWLAYMDVRQEED